MEQADKDGDDALRARIEVLRDEMKAGRVKFSSDLQLVIESRRLFDSGWTARLTFRR